MRKLATETKGRYAVAGTGMDIPAMVKSAIKDLDAFEMEGRERSVFIEFYQWLVLPAIVFLIGSILAGTRWRGVNAAVLAAGVFLTPIRRAGRRGLRRQRGACSKNATRKRATPITNSRKAPRSRTGGRRFHLGEATAAYLGRGLQNRPRGVQPRAAEPMIPRSRLTAHVGMGNTLFQLGWQSLAGESYPA